MLLYTPQLYHGSHGGGEPQGRHEEEESERNIAALCDRLWGPTGWGPVGFGLVEHFYLEYGPEWIVDRPGILQCAMHNGTPTTRDTTIADTVRCIHRVQQTMPTMPLSRSAPPPHPFSGGVPIPDTGHCR